MQVDKSIKIMIVDRNTDSAFHNDFKAAIEQDAFFEITKITDAAKEALDFYIVSPPDIIITDLNYAQGDGLSTIHKIREIEKKRCKRAYIIVVTHIVADVVLKTLSIDRLADYVFCKSMPDFGTSILLEHLYMIKDNLDDGVKVFKQQSAEKNDANKLTAEEEELKIRNYIENNIMNRLCIKPSLRGRAFLIDSIIQGLKYKGTEPIVLINDVYPAVAIKNKTNNRNIDVLINSALEKAWTNTELDVLREIYPVNLPYDRQAPTSKDFIGYHIDKLKRQFG